ncbi:MAG: hypothetical protein ACXV3V_10975 [Actinomycetes bacterium]
MITNEDTGVNAGTARPAKDAHDPVHLSPGGVPAPVSCSCPQHPGRAITDPAGHAAWHQLVEEQGGPAGLVNLATLRAARGFNTPPPTVQTAG